LTARQIEQNYVVIADKVYQPEVVPVDYAGFLVYNVAITFEDGLSFQKSSLEFDDNQNLSVELCQKVLAALTSACLEHFNKTGLLPKQKYYQPHITACYLKGKQ